MKLERVNRLFSENKNYWFIKKNNIFCKEEARFPPIRTEKGQVWE